ncbi:class I SAM-dependent methyltransferase [Methylobacter sp. S3L5C]|uniref:class I SAM-dependent methyltransferase n=1 Tax=Methylobacter sp. S3L5C TaxID=2839024 RepID=UPI001FAC171A|nr:class I SAM-dependent methyltransferase [Methylobacter sp. S3L5C]UOA09954.1 class I SAM-dependent methyltransferase [Methylobacter sp. S3L5C]
MGFALDKVVPWGRSYDEYLAMFALTEVDLGLSILGCGDGPAGFNAELTKRGGRIVSVDPLYVFDALQINKRILETRETVMLQICKNRNDYLWNTIASIEELEHVRMSAMATFLADYENGKNSERYINGELPVLPFENGKFDLALSSHFLFLYSMHMSAEFHLQALQEMLRVAREVRIFPLLTLDGTYSPHLDFVTESLANQGYRIEIKTVLYEFQKGGNEMLIIQSGCDGDGNIN